MYGKKGFKNVAFILAGLAICPIRIWGRAPLLWPDSCWLWLSIYVAYADALLRLSAGAARRGDVRGRGGTGLSSRPLSVGRSVPRCELPSKSSPHNARWIAGATRDPSERKKFHEAKGRKFKELMRVEGTRAGGACCMQRVHVQFESEGRDRR